MADSGPIIGETGTVTLTNGYVSNIKSFTLNQVADEHDITDFASTNTWTEYMTGKRRWSGTYECYLDGTTPMVLAGYDIDGAAMVMTSSTGRTFSGNAVVTGGDVTVNPADPNLVSYTFRGTGALTVA